MPTRKISEREKLTIFARTASDDELEAALEILRIEASVRKQAKQPTRTTTTRKPRVAPGPPNPPKPDNDNPVG